MDEGRRIGILGGTFNPPHLGHLVLAEEALDKLKLDKVIFIPAYMPPHKKIRDNNAAMRYKMTLLACRGNPAFEVSGIEINKKTVSYSINTIKVLKKKYGKDARLFFITGSDSLKELSSWKDIDELLKLATFVVAKRPGFTAKKPRKEVKVLEIPAIDVSSSMIRSYLKQSRSIRYLVPEPVRMFIEMRRLYK